MTLKLVRREFREDGIFSELMKDGKVIAHTLEHSFNMKPKIPDGTYMCRRGIHKLENLKPFETFEVCGVSGHTGILLHIGNWNKDSDGCILVGSGIAQSPQGQMVTGSKQAFADFMDLCEGFQSFALEVVT